MFRMLVKARPDRYIAQPTLALSTCPTLVEQGIAERHLDLRPFVLVGDRVRLTPGGLTRVALREGLAGGQLQPGRRHQGHLGTAGLAMTGRGRMPSPCGRQRAQRLTVACWPHRQRSVLDVALHRARREHRAPAGGRLPHRAAAARRRRPGRGMALDPAQRRLRARAISPSTAPTTRATSSTSCCSTPTTPRASIPAWPPPGATRAPSARR